MADAFHPPRLGWQAVTRLTHRRTSIRRSFALWPCGRPSCAMSLSRSRRRFLGQGLGLAAGGVLTPTARACEFFAPTLRITHPWTCATEGDASTAIVCMRFDEVLQDEQLLAAETPLATGAVLARAGLPTATGVATAAATLPLPLHIPAGRETVLSQQGLHLLLTGLTQPLFVGRAYPLQLRFARGGEVPALLTVDYPSFRFS